MIVRFHAEPGQASNLRVRIYTQDRSALLTTVTAGIVEHIAESGSYECEVGNLSGYWYVLVNLVDTGEVTSSGFANEWQSEVTDTPGQHNLASFGQALARCDEGISSEAQAIRSEMNQGGGRFAPKHTLEGIRRKQGNSVQIL